MVSTHNRNNEERHFYDLIQMTPVEFQSPIVTAWQAIKDIYQVQLHAMPQPVWRKRGYEDTSSEVMERIKSHLAEKRDANAISIYIHIPFCKDKKCGFCDCLSLPMRKDSPVKQFIDALLREIKIWS